MSGLTSRDPKIPDPGRRPLGPPTLYGKTVPGAPRYTTELYGAGHAAFWRFKPEVTQTGPLTASQRTIATDLSAMP